MARRNRVFSFLLGMVVAATLTLSVIWGTAASNKAEAPQVNQAQSSVIWGTRS